MKRISELWEKFRHIPFPENLAGEEIKGIDIVLLDTETAGCIATFIARKGSLDKQRAEILGRCIIDIKIVKGELDFSAQAYFSMLLDLAEMAQSSR